MSIINRNKRTIANDYKSAHNVAEVVQRFHDNISAIHAECVKAVQLESEVYEEVFKSYDLGDLQALQEEQRKQQLIAEKERELAELRGEKPIIHTSPTHSHFGNARITTIRFDSQGEKDSPIVVEENSAIEDEAVSDHFKRLSKKRGKVWLSKENVLKWKKSWITLTNNLKGYKKSNGRTSTESKLNSQKRYKEEFLKHKKMTKEFLKYLYQTKAPELKGTFNPTEHEKKAFKDWADRELEARDTEDTHSENRSRGSASSGSEHTSTKYKCVQNTEKGGRCSHFALDGKDMCRQHYNQSKKRRLS